MSRTNENCDERIAKRWLELQGYSDVRRPNDDPPDYVVEGRYGVEVRCLNWMTEVNGESEGMEGYEKPLERTIQRVLEEYDQSPNTISS